MYFKPLLIPLLAQVALTFIVMLVMFVKRVNEMKSKNILPQQVQTRSSLHGVLTDSENPASNYANLFESPVLFYLAILLTLNLMMQDTILVVLSWGYVAARYVTASYTSHTTMLCIVFMRLYSAHFCYSLFG